MCISLQTQLYTW